jgi:hypothetical protein
MEPYRIKQILFLIAQDSVEGYLLLRAFGVRRARTSSAPRPGFSDDADEGPVDVKLTSCPEFRSRYRNEAAAASGVGPGLLAVETRD